MSEPTPAPDVSRWPSPAPVTPPSRPARRRSTALVAGLSVVAALVAGLLVHVQTSRATPAINEVAGTAPPPAPDAAGPDDPNALDDPTDVPGATGITAPPATVDRAGPTAAPSSAPVVTSFVAPPTVDCHDGDVHLATLSWTTTNAVKVTIAIDGTGVYKTAGPSGADTAPFICPTPHRFELTAVGPTGATATKTIDVAPSHVPPPA